MPPPYQPAGRCIYCGATAYDPKGFRRALGEEHVIPAGIGGTLVLPEASCRKCETTINEYESKCINGMLAPMRAHLGLRTRTNKVRDKVWTGVRPRGQRDQKVGVPLDEHPPALLTPRFIYPTILSGERLEGSIVSRRFELSSREDHEERANRLAERLDLAGLDITPPIDTRSYHLMLAKIAHAFAWAEWRGAFDPLLTPWITGEREYSNELCQYVGSELESVPRTDQLHTLVVGTIRGTGGVLLVAVRLHLFARVSATNHVAIVGLARQR